MAALTYPTHLLTLAEWDALPEDEGYRTECTEGVLIVTPSPTPEHQDVLGALFLVLHSQLPGRLRPVLDVDVLLAEGPPPTIRRPDLIVRSGARPERYTAADVLLAVEVVSPGTRRQDTVTKLAEYADAGVPRYWVVDPERRTLTAFDLRQGPGHDEVVHTEQMVLTVTEDCTVALNLPQLLDG